MNCNNSWWNAFQTPIFKPNDKKEPWLIELLEPDDDKEDGEGEYEAQEHHTARQNCRVHVHLR